jgi:hypothetical protein
VTFACATMISQVFSFVSALLISSSLPSAATYQCHIDDNAKCPCICCNQDPYRLLVGPTCSIQAFWFSSKNGTVWPFPTFRFSYYVDQESSDGSIMGGETSKEDEEETTEVLTMHPSRTRARVRASKFEKRLANLYLTI